YFVPNGEITTVVNMSRGFAHAVIDAGIGYGADVDQVMALMREVADEMRRDPAWTPRIEGEFELAGVESWGDSAVTVRGRIRTRPGDQWAVRRELLRRLKYAFDKAGVEIPFPQRTVHVVGGKTDAGTAAVAGS
ncbi:MAG TPA: mechanosensitive ion channel family protein, partial [Rubrivivax sp.]|nr:mechanosensitive ion channel family protein [Rubrivivax sp.]